MHTSEQVPSNKDELLDCLVGIAREILEREDLLWHIESYDDSDNSDEPGPRACLWCDRFLRSEDFPTHAEGCIFRRAWLAIAYYEKNIDETKED